MNEYTVLLTWDDEARVWVAENDEIPLALESGSLDVLMEQVRLTAPEILELNGKEHVNAYINFAAKRRAKVYA
ncbi:antitoxin HicB [Spirochaetia bacterium]|nr:antitoxin HicB [Spirochaetia bacterium]